MGELFPTTGSYKLAISLNEVGNFVSNMERDLLSKVWKSSLSFKLTIACYVIWKWSEKRYQEGRVRTPLHQVKCKEIAGENNLSCFIINS